MHPQHCHRGKSSAKVGKIRIKVIVLVNYAPNEGRGFDLERRVLCTSFSIAFKTKKISTEMQTSQNCVSHTSVGVSVKIKCAYASEKPDD